MLLELIGAVVVLLIIKWWRMKPLYWQGKGVPYALPLPIFGNILGSFFDSFGSFWSKRYKRFSNSGGMYGFHNFNRISLMVSDPDALTEMLVHKSDCFTSRGMHSNPEYDLFARSVFFSSGNKWKRLRTKLTPYFSPLRLKHLVQQMSTDMSQYSNHIEKAADSKRDFDVQNLSLKLAVDVVVNTIFGIKPDAFINPDSFFFALQDEVFGHNFVLRLLLGTVSPFTYDLFKVTTFPRKTISKLEKFVQNVFEQRKSNIGVRPDFIQGMLELVQKEAITAHDLNSPRFTEDEAISQCMVMYVAGTETTGNTISYLLNELALNQEIQQRVREEINDVLSKSEGGIFTYDLLPQLTYTNMVINECLRKYPIVPVITRECTKATRVAGIDIEVGTGIFVPIIGIHGDPKYYPEPEKFNPERFANQTNKDNMAYYPFGIGPRTCIGWKMAINETAFALSVVLPKYKFLPSARTKPQIKFNWKPTLNPEGGIWLKVEKL